MPIYSGGLGVLSGDTLKSAADQGLNVVGIGVLWRKGYFRQRLWYEHGQIVSERKWEPKEYPGLIPLNKKISIETKEGVVWLKLWKYYVYSYDKKKVCPIVLLSADVPENPEHFQKLTDQLYNSEHPWWQILQRAVLGMGGLKAIEALGYNIDCYHLNEGHGAFALLEAFLTENKNEDVFEKFVYTCHTPVEAGHDRFSYDDLSGALKDEYVDLIKQWGSDSQYENVANLTQLCLNKCRAVNAVAQKHGEITRIQFPEHRDKIQAITNGIHMHTWLSESFKNLFLQYQKHFGDWQKYNHYLSNIDQLKSNMDFRSDLFTAHQQNKKNLLKLFSHWDMDENVLTLCWARRMTGYKRPTLIFHDIEQLLDIAYNVGPLQIIISGKAHPNDEVGAAYLKEVLEAIEKLNNHKKVIKVLLVENYNTYLGKQLTSGVDVWLNNPLPPFEASGTSGMKAILNGVLQLSTLDGWVVESKDDDIGWIFGWQHEGNQIGQELDSRLDEDSKALYETLRKIAQQYYQMNNDGRKDYSSPWIDKMMNCVSRAAFFNTQRMVQEYQQKIWKLKDV